MNLPIETADLSVRIGNFLSNEGYFLGADSGDRILDISRSAANFGLKAPADMDDLLQNQRAPEVQAVLERAKQNPAQATFLSLNSVHYAPLVTRPEKIICVGFNYSDHAKETGTPIPAAPPLFAKFRNTLNHHGGTIRLPTRVARQFDYETELVIIFGKECRDVPEDKALSVVAGYTIGNDFSARELQTATSQFLAGKASDGFAPLGPWLNPAGLVPDPNSLQLTTTVNGENRQNGTTQDMIYDCRKLISFVTGIMTIRPGDVLFTGTPKGVILGYDGPRETRPWLKAGDKIISEIEGLGALQFNLVEDRP